MPGIAEGMVLAMLVLWWLLFWFWLWLWLFFFVFFLKNDDDGEYKRDRSQGNETTEPRPLGTMARPTFNEEWSDCAEVCSVRQSLVLPLSFFCRWWWCVA